MADQPNGRLRAVITEAAMTQDAVARAVRVVSREAGDTTLKTNRSAVCHWLKGTVPDETTIRYLTEALGRRLRRPLTPEDIGLPSPGQDFDLGLSLGHDTIGTITRMGRADIERRNFLTNAVYSVAAAALPLGVASEHQARAATAAHGGTVGTAEVEAVRSMTAAFTKIDELQGGQHGRSALLYYLTHDVADLLDGRFASDKIRSEMFTAAASLVYLAGWKAHDAGQAGLAQRYYLQAYGLTQEARDDAHAAFCIRILAHHGMDNARPEHTLALADSALERARGHVDKATESLFVICRARALAVSGQGTRALREAARARTMAEAGNPEAGWAALWGTAQATVSSHTAKINAYLRDYQTAEDHYTAAARRYGMTEHRRITGLSNIQSGRMQLKQGRTEEACNTWGHALDALAGVQSARARRAVRAVRGELATLRHRGVHEAEELDNRARLWLQTT
ncbi:hypothetical protein [Streptomyces syringium]|uniref:hypothetical protein n=1 Tax=Streptomyces syringium TaxID=76729 RepID=UPI0037D36AE4